MKTFLAKPADKDAGEHKRTWYVVDATGQTLGRFATRLARVLMGKHKPAYTPYVDLGDFVVVVNADKVKVTGKKRTDKRYLDYSGYRGGLKKAMYDEVLERHPTKILKLAVRRMLPKSDMGQGMLSKLKAYKGPDHPHGAQQPKPLDLSKI